MKRLLWPIDITNVSIGLPDLQAWPMLHDGPHRCSASFHQIAESKVVKLAYSRLRLHFAWANLFGRFPMNQFAVLAAALLSTSAFAADPATIAVPAGQTLAMTAVGVGELTYECKVKAAMPGAHEWVFVGPVAVLMDKATKATVGKYYAGPTWEANDGSKVTGKQLGVSPGNAGSIPLQLVQTAPAIGTGAMTGITYIQRMNTKGGVAPADACGADNVGAKKTVKYEADYLFYKAS